VPGLTAVDILIEPDEVSIRRAREINQRMLRSVPDGIVLDATHEPHITMLQRYLVTESLDQAYAAIEQAAAGAHPDSLSYHVAGIAYSEHWGPPGQAAAALAIEPSRQVLDLQADLVSAVTAFTGPGGTAAAFVTDPGEEISPTTMSWVETYVPDQTGPNYTAHLTVGVARVADLKAIQAEPFDAFDVRPAGLAVYRLGNNGTARTLLRS
jgi:2'-5' RNA ligase superfamily protein